MLKAIFTLDYEIHGNGEGCPAKLMVEPTERQLALFDRYGAKLTIMADVAEILRFKEYKERSGRDDFHYEAITAQLRGAIRRGHDVQLHIHSSYFNARYQRGRWVQDWSEYNFAGLPLDRLREVIRLGKDFLEELLQPVDPNYRCKVFRAANWSVSPSRNVVRALLDNGITIDTSVFKYGRRQGIVNFDYRQAWSALVPWKVDENDICAHNDNGQLFEFPIYAENRLLGAFLTPQRVFRACVGRLHRVSNGSGGRPPSRVCGMSNEQSRIREPGWLRRRHAWKADFNQCSGRQLIRALERAQAQYDLPGAELPFVLIGHSKLFTALNQWSLRPFLAHVAKHAGRFAFATFDGCTPLCPEAPRTAADTLSSCIG